MVHRAMNYEFRLLNKFKTHLLIHSDSYSQIAVSLKIHLPPKTAISTEPKPKSFIFFLLPTIPTNHVTSLLKIAAPAQPTAAFFLL